MENNKIIDIHTHILFGIDDGARNLEESIDMARQWVNQSVDTVVACPHFDIIKDDKEEFLETRSTHLKILRKELKHQDIDLTVLSGAELYFRNDLIYEDLRPYLIEGTNYLLIELPLRTTPPRIKSTFEELILQGYNPILVHIERYSVLKNDLDLLYDLAEMGVILQVNAETILNKQSSWLKATIRKNYVHLLASDAHRNDMRQPNITRALDESNQFDYFSNNARNVINNKDLETSSNKKIIKVFNTYL